MKTKRKVAVLSNSPVKSETPKAESTVEGKWRVEESIEGGAYITNGHVWLRQLQKIADYLNRAPLREETKED